MGYWMNYAVPNHERRVYNFGPGTGRYLLVPAFSPILTACAQGRRLTLAEIRRGNREAGEKGWDAWELFEMEPEGAAFPQNWRKNILIGLAKEGEEDQDDVVVEPGQVARVQWLEVEGCAVQGDHILSRIASVSLCSSESDLGVGSDSHPVREYPSSQPESHQHGISSQLPAVYVLREPDA